MAMLTSGILENPNNSLQAHFKNQSQRQARNQEKQRELESEPHSATPDNYINVDAMFNSPPMKSLELFPSFHSPSTSVNSMSDFDYQAALNSDIMSPTLNPLHPD
ncbi:hypothetical protein B0H11DRAFT_2235320 [Mycena galericulata]|nr:hypothetical protein B0H11DRAFT_2235320 [Mycena galericulata]